jgi:hypothetical protein
MIIESRSQRNLTSGLTKMVEQVLGGDYSTQSISADALLSTAIASFFPQFRQYGGRTLELIMDGHVTEVVFPKGLGGTWELRENDTTIALTGDERAIVLSLAAAIAMNPYQFEKFAFKGLDS